MIGALAAVLLNPPAEFRKRHQPHAVGIAAGLESLEEVGDGITKVVLDGSLDIQSDESGTTVIAKLKVS